jgi:hypothetical protein
MAIVIGIWNTVCPDRGFDSASKIAARARLPEALHFIQERAFWPITPGTLLAALRYLPVAHRVPFRVLSRSGGIRSEIEGRGAAARPVVVGYVDIGYGSAGIAAFAGLNCLL